MLDFGVLVARVATGEGIYDIVGRILEEMVDNGAARDA